MNLSDYDAFSGAVLGICKFIEERYPNDRIMHEKLQDAVTYSLKLGHLIGKDSKSAEKFYNEIMNERKMKTNVHRST